MPRRLQTTRINSTSTTLPAPVGGWNARDGLANMPPTDAVILENMVPTPTFCLMRSGYTQWATGLGSQVETLMGYHGGATDKLFAAAGTKIYDVSATGAVGAAKVSGLTNARWQYVNITTAGGSYIRLVNGADLSYIFDGTNWSQDGSSAPADISGVTSSTLIHVNLHKNRLWFCQVNTLKAWYLATNAVGGTATSFDLSSIAQRGGYLMAMATWTVDSGQGADDLAVFITSNGEIIVYKGTDPSSVSTWALVGVWWIGSPVGRRCFVKYAGDVAIICQDGVYPLSGALQGDRLNPTVALSNKIQYAVSDAVSNYGSTYGWQILPYPQQNLLILNVPVAVGNQQQYVMNTIKRADGDYSWCNFTGWAANCWELYNNQPYFGGNGYVGKAWNTNADAGSAITARGLQAFNYFRSPGREKRFTLLRPTFQASGIPAVSANINTDFNEDDTTATLSFSPLNYASWDSAVWDVSVWAGSNSTIRAWEGTTGHGFSGSPFVKVVSSGMEVMWVSTDVVYEIGGML